LANNRFYVKRTSTTGRTPNTTGSYATNTQYIGSGELALNLTDKILYSSDGTNLIYVGANQINQSVTNTLTVSTGFTANATQIVIGAAAAVSANGTNGTTGQVLTSTSSGNVYWASPAAATVNVAATYVWTNNNTFTANLTVGNSSTNAAFLTSYFGTTNPNTFTGGTITTTTGFNTVLAGPFTIATGNTLVITTGSRIVII